MSNLDKAKEIIKEHYNHAQCGIFDTRNMLGDPMDTLYDEKGLNIEICYFYEYFEVFGLTDDEFLELSDFYDSLRKE